MGKHDDGVSIILDVLHLLSAQGVHLGLPQEELAAAEAAATRQQVKNDAATP